MVSELNGTTILSQVWLTISETMEIQQTLTASQPDCFVFFLLAGEGTVGSRKTVPNMSLASCVRSSYMKFRKHILNGLCIPMTNLVVKNPEFCPRPCPLKTLALKETAIYRWSFLVQGKTTDWIRTTQILIQSFFFFFLNNSPNPKGLSWSGLASRRPNGAEALRDKNLVQIAWLNEAQKQEKEAVNISEPKRRCVFFLTVKS